MQNIKSVVISRGKNRSRSTSRFRAGNGQFVAAIARGPPNHDSPGAEGLSSARVSSSNRQSPGARGSSVAGTRVSPKRGSNRFSILEDRHD